MSDYELPPDRVTVVETIYHSPANQQPFSIVSRFSRDLTTKEQLYERYLTATEEWTQLESGWLGDNVGMMSIHNLEGEFLQVIPTPEEKEEAEKKILVLSPDPFREDYPDYWLIPPRESMRGCPTRVEGLWIKSLSGNTKYRICLVPG